MEESIEELIERATEDPVEFVGAYLGIKGTAQSLQAENKRLREALEELKEWHEGQGFTLDIINKALKENNNEARNKKV